MLQLVAQCSTRVAQQSLSRRRSALTLMAYFVMPKFHLQTLWSTFASVAWAEPLPQLIQAIANKQRQHILQLVSWAYSSIQPERLAALTGTSSADVLQRMFQWPMASQQFQMW